MLPPWKKRFLESTRGRAVQILRSGSRTVDELAHIMGLSGTSVRAHLSQLESDGVVHHTPRRGSGKPTQVYSLDPDAEAIFHRAYGPLLAEVIQLLGERVPPTVASEVMKDAGRRLASGRAVPVGDVATRIRAASAILTEMGGMAEVIENEDHTFSIQGLACPIATVSAGHSEACVAIESFLEVLIGAPVRECCERGDRPKCHFKIAAQAYGSTTASSTAASTGISTTIQ